MPNAKGDLKPPPLTLVQVLEEEYERLHGALPEGYDRTADAERRLENLFSGIRDKKHVALCLSGGGIRSGTFAVGVLQGLARHGLLKHCHYLSTVSGGGYAGGWLSAWIHRHRTGLEGVAEELSEPPQSKLEVEPETLSYLRSYSNYLSPKLGMLSGDTWTLVAIVARNLILNWLVLIPLLVAVLALPRLLMAIIRWSPTDDGRPFALAATIVLAIGFGVVSTVYVGIKRPSVNLKKKDDQRNFLVLCMLPLLVSGLSLIVYWAWLRNQTNQNAIQRQLTLDLFGAEQHYVVPFIIFGVLLSFLSWLLYSVLLRHFRIWDFVSTIATGALGGVVLWLVATRVFPYPRSETVLFDNVAGVMTYACFAVPIYLGLFFLAITLFAGVSSKWTEDEDREWWARYGAWLFISIVVWSLISALVLMGPGLLEYVWTKYVVAAGGLFGLVTTLLGRSSFSSGKKDQEKVGGVRGLLLRLAIPLGAILLAIALIILLSLGTNYLLQLLSNFLGWLLPSMSGAVLPQTAALAIDKHARIGIILGSPVPLVLFLIVVMTALGVGMAYLVSTNKFSHHAMYRNRIIRAYLGASRGGDDIHDHRDVRDPNLFTGFDPDDNLPMHELRPELFHPGSFIAVGNFLAQLKDPKVKFSQYLMNQIRALPSDQTVVFDFEEQLEREWDADNPPKAICRSLIKVLNKLIQSGTSLYHDQAFQDVVISGETLELLKASPRGDALILLNRKLLEAAYPNEIEPCPPPPQTPLHVVNMTLNLVRGDKLAWQERQAASFTVSPLHAGSFQIPNPKEEEAIVHHGSYRRSEEYGGKDLGGISLGTAIAVSGAAVSPNMGYYSSPFVTFLMTLFNVRLGWWLGNPGRSGQCFYHLAHPRSAVYPIVAEALGLTDDKNSYVYLSDGGHFENLGLYEMVLRRSSVIIVCDATGDDKFEFNELGNAIRKIRIDLGVPIEFEAMPIYPRSQNKLGKYCALGRIVYSCVDKEAPDGVLVYLKPAFYGNVGGGEPRDVYHYAQANKQFPHESTADQFFGESQFESYRMLGSHMCDKILGDKRQPLTPDHLIVQAYKHMGRRLAWLETWLAKHEVEFTPVQEKKETSPPAPV